jgi:spoIIIJ-associated protein
MSDTTSTEDLTAEQHDLTTDQQDDQQGTAGTGGTGGEAPEAPEAPATLEAEEPSGSASYSGQADGDSDTDDTDDEAEAQPEAQAGAETSVKPEKGSRVRQLEREGEVAADFLETLLDIADLDGDLDVDVDGDRAAVAIVDSEEGRVPRRLVGQDGKVLEALQELTRLAVQVETGERSRLMLDIAGHRAERREALVELARVAIAEVKASGEKKSLDAMSAFERKVVHDEVAAAGLESESEGVDPKRHVVILPA